MSDPAEWTGDGPAPVACGARVAAEAKARHGAGGGPVPDTCLVVACPEHSVPVGVPCWKPPVRPTINDLRRYVSLELLMACPEGHIREAIKIVRSRWESAGCTITTERAAFDASREVGDLLASWRAPVVDA